MIAVANASWRVWVVKMDRRGRITLPIDVRERLRIRLGDTLVIRKVEGGLRIEREPNVKEGDE
ncbi:MAG TPA: AbrB/MazE/SpoVT family DNA-binding domain-containing protein [Gemmataceae bacterium]|nr:AbrB/MazE/SpoVT family DNA-binding domain-containing protein [Gemmataceae bacterium]